MFAIKKIFFPIIIITYVLLNGFFIVPYVLAGDAAPYTKDAYERIEKVAKNYIPPKFSNSMTGLEREKASVNQFRKIFELAGYDYDATIRKIAYDLKNDPDGIVKILKQGHDNVATMIIWGMGARYSEREYMHYDYLDCYDNQTAEAIKSIWNDAGSIKKKQKP